jgi:hypothetical protein
MRVAVASEGNEIDLSKALAELYSAGRGVVRSSSSPLQMSLTHRQQQVALLDALPPFPLARRCT